MDVALNGLDGRYFIEQQDYDLIILDVMLPGLNGWQLLQLIRQRGATPVLFLTARDAIEDRVRGLELGADDYLLKPFAFAELLDLSNPESMAVLKRELTVPGAERIWYVADAFRAGMTVEDIFGMNMIDQIGRASCRERV